MSAADGTVLALDVATTPVIAAYNAFQPEAEVEKTAETTIPAESVVQPVSTGIVPLCVALEKNRLPLLTVISPVRMLGADTLNPVAVNE